jgi:kynureninase
MQDLQQRSRALAALARKELAELPRQPWQIMTPEDPQRHAALLSLRVPAKARAWEEHLFKAGVVCDSRGEDILRVSFAPLYNDEEDVCLFVRAVRKLI